jgi:integrase
VARHEVLVRPHVQLVEEALAEARTFLKWCVKMGWLATNPLDGVEGVGRRRHGKDQLRIDEARKWIARATELADQGQRLAAGKRPTDLIFGAHDRDWPRHWVQRICTEARVPVLTAHGQRGLHATLAVEAGVPARAVADALGHESFATTAQSYAKAEGVDRAQQERTLTVLRGGKSAQREAA